eukprot:4145971-Prymnesium_polylepis.1
MGDQRSDGPRAHRELRDLLLHILVDVDARGAGHVVRREVTHVVEGCLEDERVSVAHIQGVLGVGDDVRVAQILQVVGATVGVEDQIPVDPADRPEAHCERDGLGCHIREGSPD